MDKDFLKIFFDDKIQYVNLSSILYIDGYKDNNMYKLKIYFINKESVEFNFTSKEIYNQMISGFDKVLHIREVV